MKADVYTEEAAATDSAKLSRCFSKLAELADLLKAQRDEAREAAVEYRYKFATAMGGRYDDERFRLPWEGEE